MVTSLPSSNSNKGASYVPGEFPSTLGQRRVLVWRVLVRTQGRPSFMTLKDDLGPVDLPGTARR